MTPVQELSYGALRVLCRSEHARLKYEIERLEHELSPIMRRCYPPSYEGCHIPAWEKRLAECKSSQAALEAFLFAERV